MRGKNPWREIYRTPFYFLPIIPMPRVTGNR